MPPAESRHTSTKAEPIPSSPSTLEEHAADLDRVRRELEAALGWAEKRIDFYASVDAAVQLAIADALRHAVEIKAETEREAKALIDKVAAEKAALVKEIESLRGQRASLQQEVAGLRSRAEREAAEILSRAQEEAAALLADAESRKAAILGEIAALEQHLSEVGTRVSRFLSGPPEGGVGSTNLS